MSFNHGFTPINTDKKTGEREFEGRAERPLRQAVQQRGRIEK